jgi:hypothetical protein
VDVFRAGFLSHQDHLLAFGDPADRVVRVKDDSARCGPRACGQAHGERFDPLGRELGFGWEPRLKQLLEGTRIDPEQCVLFGEDPFPHHVDRHPDRGVRSALRRSRLQQVRAPILDGELDVLQVAEVGFEGDAVFGDRLEGFW